MKIGRSQNDEFDWDPSKAAQNAEKHNVEFEAAMYLFSGTYFFKEGTQGEYGEFRFIAYGEVDGRLLAVVYTDRGKVRRIISARKANAREQRAYHQALAQRPPPDN